MIDRPTAAELLAAVRQFLEGEVVPALADARLRYQALVAANVLAIVERELPAEEEQLLWEWEWLAEMEGVTGPAPPRLAALRQAVADLNFQLCERIRQGEFDDSPRFQALASQLRRTVERKLEIANPRYLAAVRAERAQREHPSADST
jgi:hypothetical protein